MSEELKGVWQANTNTLVWRQVIHKKGRPIEKTCQIKLLEQIQQE